MKAQYYIAYGSNLNKEMMSHRCPSAIPVGTALLDGWRLVFNCYATVIPCENSVVPVGVWKIDHFCERALDIYEGFPDLYRKEYIEVTVGRETVTAMIYIMNEGAPRMPSGSYMSIVREGYRDFGLDEQFLDDALACTRRALGQE